jgi:hypothetical protein
MFDGYVVAGICPATVTGITIGVELVNVVVWDCAYATGARPNASTNGTTSLDRITACIAHLHKLVFAADSAIAA